MRTYEGRAEFLPEDCTKPFITYGIFMPGQIAYHQIREFVDISRSRKVEINGHLKMRDGVVLYDKSDVEGAIDVFKIHFRKGTEREAYSRIAAMEPRNLFFWDSVNVEGEGCNILSGRKPTKGVQDHYYIDYGDSWNDPMFTDALSVIRDDLDDKIAKRDIKSFFRLQMAYLLLWSALERYTTLRYGLGLTPNKRITMLADDEMVRASIAKYVKAENQFKVYKSDDPERLFWCKADNPISTINALYQLRSNITHRGKSFDHDQVRLLKAAKILLDIFEDVLSEARKAALHDLQQIESLTHE